MNKSEFDPYPQHPGLYWWRKDYRGEWIDLKVHSSSDDQLFVVHEGVPMNANLVGGEWFGPVARPSDTNQCRVLNAVIEERIDQDRKHGSLLWHRHEIPSWIAIIRHQLNLAELEWVLKQNDGQQAKSLVAVAASAIAALEQHGLPEAT